MLLLWNFQGVHRFSIYPFEFRIISVFILTWICVICKNGFPNPAYEKRLYCLNNTVFKCFHIYACHARVQTSLTDITITNVLTDNLYNDSGFIADNKLMILVEAQSAWIMNILVRVLLYLAQSYHEYFRRTSQNYYKIKNVKMPKPELYVIFTGNKGRKPDKISLSKEFFEGADVDIEVKVIYESDTDDIISQYVTAVFHIPLNCIKHA